MATKYSGRTQAQLIPLLDEAMAREDPALYQRDLAEVMSQLSSPDPQGARKYALAKQLNRAGASIGLTGKDLAHFKNDILQDQQTGKVNEKSWWGRHGFLGPALLMVGAGVGGPIIAGAVAGAASPAVAPAVAPAAAPAAAPATVGTAGGLTKVLSTASQVAPILGQMSAGRAAGAQNDYNNQLMSQRLRNDALQQEYQNSVQQKRMESRRVLRQGNPLLKHFGLNDTSRLPSLPSLPSLSTGGPDPNSSSILDNILSVAGPAASIMGALDQQKKKKPAVPPSMPPDWTGGT